jgi:predicted AAA+ superfamily ATPase
MIERGLWTQSVQMSWKKASICWLTGVRRSGKTTLAKSFPGRYLNCDLPQTAELLKDPEAFYKSVQHPIVIFDEIHQLEDPSRVMKIGADQFPSIKILATGSSSLAATQKFSDSLTGRKRSVTLLPILYSELANFGCADLRLRLFRGGLPQALLAEEHDPGFYAEWLDSYFARDVQELFHVEKRSGFLKLLELVLRQNGGLFEATSLAKHSGLSRPTVLNYLDVFETTHVIHILRPYHGGGRQEILQQPKIYGFDSGFVCHVQGWTNLRESDCRDLWEQLVLDMLLSSNLTAKIHFWRDKQKREVDFVLPGVKGAVEAIECKWNPETFEPKNLGAFRTLYPRGHNWVVSPFIKEPYTGRWKSLLRHSRTSKKNSLSQRTNRRIQ